MFDSIRNLHYYEHQILTEIADKILQKANEAMHIFNGFQEFNEKINLNQNQHKVLSFLFSIYHLDQSSKQRHKQSLHEITRAISESSSRSDRFMRACQKLVKMGLIYRDEERQYYITKYGIFFMYSECQERDWDGELVANATLAAIEKETNNLIRDFIAEKLQDDERKEEIIGKSEDEEDKTDEDDGEK